MSDPRSELAMHAHYIVPVLVVLFILWRIYVRMRRSFGRQRVQPRRMTVRITLLALIGILVLGASPNLWALGAVLAGAACGALLGLLGLRHTQFQSTSEGRFYTPHTYIGLSVTALFLGRLVYDALLFSHDMQAFSAGPTALLAAEQSNPLTLALSGAVIAYYLTYYFGVLRRSRQAAPGAPVIPTSPTTPE